MTPSPLLLLVVRAAQDIPWFVLCRCVGIAAHTHPMVCAVQVFGIGGIGHLLMNSGVLSSVPRSLAWLPVPWDT